MRVFVLTSLMLLGAYCASADVCAPGTLQDYINLPAGCTVGGALFADFYLGSGQNGATPIPPSQVLVTPTGTPLAPVLLFTLGQSAAAPELFEAFFHFDVSAQLGSATMTLIGSNATGDGAAIASADICPNALFLGVEPVGCPTSPESLITFVTDSSDGLTDSRSFTATSFFDVFTDLTVDGGLGGTAHFGSASFGVTVTPEPVTVLPLLILMGCGALAIGRSRRRV